MEEELRRALARIPTFEEVEIASLETERLGGLTNRNYRVRSPSGHYVLRLAGEGTSAYIDRAVEEHNARIAAEAGVNAEVVYFDADDGTMLCRYVEDSVTMDGRLFEDFGAVRRAARAFRQLHGCGRMFRGRFDLFEQIDNYLATVEALDAPIPDGYAEVHREAEAVRSALAAHELPLAPCHCDPLAENFLDTGERMYIIDFEYAGNNDPMWDLGDLSVEAGFAPEQDRACLQAYFEGDAPQFETGRMVMYKAMCDLLWTLWGVVQFANDNPAEDFWVYAVNRLDRCRRLMEESAFSGHLEAVRRGP